LQKPKMKKLKLKQKRNLQRKINFNTQIIFNPVKIFLNRISYFYTNPIK
jgi:hypothetical protein